MSNYFELLRMSGRGQRLFARGPGNHAVLTSEVLEEPERTATEVSSQAAESGDTGWRSAEEQPCTISAEPGAQPEPLQDSCLRYASALDDGVHPFASMHSIAAWLRGALGTKGAEELASIAREEQIKLVQQVFLNAATRKTVVFSGVNRGDGCSRVCAESAISLAHHTSGTVCLLDADLRSPSLHRAFGIKNGPGLAEAMGEPLRIQECSQALQGYRNLSLVTAGSWCASEGCLPLNPDTLSDRIHELRECFDYVLIDAPPLLSSADATKLGSLTDGVVLVLGANSTRREAARKAKDDLEAAHCRIVAAVLNRRTFPVPDAIYRRI